MAKVDDQLIDEFMRVAETEHGYVLEVGVVGWDGPHTPFITWKRFRKWRHVPTPCNSEGTRNLCALGIRGAFWHAAG